MVSMFQTGCPKGTHTPPLANNIVLMPPLNGFNVHDYVLAVR